MWLVEEWGAGLGNAPREGGEVGEYMEARWEAYDRESGITGTLKRSLFS